MESAPSRPNLDCVAPAHSTWATLRKALGLGMLSVVTVGVFLRLTLRDRIPYLSVVYYALPLPVLAVFAWTAATLLWRRCQVFRFASFVAVAVTVWFAALNFVWRGTAGSPQAIRVAFWNVSRGAGGWDEVAEDLNRIDADLIGMVEAGRASDMQEFWSANFPTHDVRALPGGMALLVKGDVLSHAVFPLSFGGVTTRVSVRCRGVEWIVWIVDVHSDPLMPRGPAMEALAELVTPDLGRPLLIMGDFNTPADSAAFDSFHTRMQHAFANAGTGYAATWPVPFPVLAIDHIWADRSLHLEEGEHRWSLHSDHRTVVVRIEPPQQGDSAGRSP